MSLLKRAEKKESTTPAPQADFFEVVDNATPQKQAAPARQEVPKGAPTNSQGLTWIEWNEAKSRNIGPTREFIEDYGEEPPRK